MAPKPKARLSSSPRRLDLGLLCDQTWTRYLDGVHGAVRKTGEIKLKQPPANKLRRGSRLYLIQTDNPEARGTTSSFHYRVVMRVVFESCIAFSVAQPGGTLSLEELLTHSDVHGLSKDELVALLAPLNIVEPRKGYAYLWKFTDIEELERPLLVAGGRERAWIQFDFEKLMPVGAFASCVKRLRRNASAASTQPTETQELPTELAVVPAAVKALPDAPASCGHVGPTERKPEDRSPKKC